MFENITIEQALNLLTTWWSVGISGLIVIAVPCLVAWLRRKLQVDPTGWTRITLIWWAWAPTLLLSSGLWCVAGRDTGYPIAWLVWIEAGLGVLLLGFAQSVKNRGESPLGVYLIYMGLILTMSSFGGRAAADAFATMSSEQDTGGLHLTTLIVATSLLAALAYLLAWLSQRLHSACGELFVADAKNREATSLKGLQLNNLIAASTSTRAYLLGKHGLRAEHADLFDPVEHELKNAVQAVRLEACNSEPAAYIELSAHLSEAVRAAQVARTLQDERDMDKHRQWLRRKVAEAKTSSVMALYHLHEDRRPCVLAIALDVSERIGDCFLTNELSAREQMDSLWSELGPARAWFLFDRDRIAQMIRRGHPVTSSEQLGKLFEQIERIAMAILAQDLEIVTAQAANAAVHDEWVRLHGSKLDLANFNPEGAK